MRCARYISRRFTIKKKKEIILKMNSCKGQKLKRRIITVEKYKMKGNSFNGSKTNMPEGITKLLSWLDVILK